MSADIKMSLVSFRGGDVYLDGAKSAFRQIGSDIMRNLNIGFRLVPIRSEAKLQSLGLPSGGVHEEDYIARCQKAYLVVTEEKLDTVEKCRDVLREYGYLEVIEYVHPCYYGSYDDKHIYVIEILSSSFKEDFQYEFSNPPRSLSKIEVKRRAEHCRQLKDNMIAKLPEDYFFTACNYYVEKRKVCETDRSKLKKVGSWITFHTFGYVLFFKPSISEVVSQLPNYLFDDKSRYLFETDILTDYAPNSHIYNTYHIAVTTLYEDSEKSAIDFENVDETKNDIEIKEEDNICSICLSEPADTLVLPCMHQVVCKKCSAQLRNTPDHATCVRCRRKITEVIE